MFHQYPASCPPRSQRLIQAAFLKNDLLKNLDEGEIRAIIACMYPTTINQGCYVIQEGANGAQAYVLEGTESFFLQLQTLIMLEDNY